MPKIEDDNVSVEFLRRQLQSLKGLPDHGLKDGDGGGTSDGMEARVKRLEDDGKELRSDLKTIMRDLSEIKGRVNAMPTTWQMIGLIVAMAIAIFTVIRVALPI